MAYATDYVNDYAVCIGLEVPRGFYLSAPSVGTDKATARAIVRRARKNGWVAVVVCLSSGFAVAGDDRLTFTGDLSESAFQEYP